MKNTLARTAAALSAVTLISSCAHAPEAPVFDPESCTVKTTLAQLAEKNTEEEVLRCHENYCVIVNIFGDYYDEYLYFRSSDLFFYEYFKPAKREHNADLYYSGGRWYMDYSESGLPELEYRWYAMSDDEMKAMILPADGMSLLDEDILSKERIYSITDKENGTAQMFTTEGHEAANELLAENKLTGFHFNGSRFDHCYTFDTETNDLLYRADYLTLASGKKACIYDTEILYDANEPDFMRMVMALADNAMNDGDAKNVTLTAVYDDGQTFTMQYNGNYKVSIVPRDGYTAYTDAQKSAVVDGMLPYADTTVYLFRE